MAYKEMDEGRLLRPHGMKLEKAGEWPCFELTDAEVTSPVDGSMQNLLLAGTGSQLFQARGLLKSPGEDNRASCASKSSTHILAS